MLRPKPQLNLQNAREYFRAHLCVGDYYSERHKITGEWLGAGAEMLGLRGRVEERAFLEPCEGKNPASGERLTQQLNSVRLVDGKAPQTAGMYRAQKFAALLRDRVTWRATKCRGGTPCWPRRSG